MNVSDMADVMEFLYAHRAPNLPADALAEVLDRLIWCLDDNGDAIMRVQESWLQSDDRDRVEISLIWAGEMSEDPDFFVPIHVSHLQAWCPAAMPFLLLPPGWRFLTAGDYEDVWFDPDVDLRPLPARRQRMWLAELRDLGVAVEDVTNASELVAMVRPLIATLKLIRRLDASDLGREDIVRWLHSLPLDPASVVTLLWPSNQRGAHLRYCDLADYFDELWAPASHDVWVFEPRTPAWVLELNHEEVFSWWSLGAR